MTVILWNLFRAGRIAHRGQILADERARGRKVEGRAFDDVIICSNAQTLLGLIIRRPRSSAVSLLAFADA